MSLKTKQDITIGCDPEFFLFDSTTGKYVSAHGLVPGDKKNPYKLKKGAVQLDGTAIEFNINPTNDPKEFKENILSVLKEIRAMVPKKYSFSFVPEVFYEKQYFDEVIPKECLVLGCEPDFSSVTGKMKAIPKFRSGSRYERMRTGAGHIHVGWTSGVQSPHQGSHFEDTKLVSYQLYRLFCDYYRLQNLWEISMSERNKLYGSEGAFRPKPYGLEFRALSNAWVKYPNIYSFIAGITQSSVFCLYSTGYLPILGDIVFNHVSPDNSKNKNDLAFFKDDYRRLTRNRLDHHGLPKTYEETYQVLEGKL